MILEGIVTTEDVDGGVNIAPMGPIVDDAMRVLLLRPYQTSTTFQNLKRTRRGVLHVIDDVELLARAALDRLEAPPRAHREPGVEGWILSDACRWHAFEVQDLDDSRDRSEISAFVTSTGHLRDFFGFNRAKHAVLEGAILATRLHILPREEVLAEFARLATPVQKTGGPREFAAFEFLRSFVADHYGISPAEVSAPAQTEPSTG